MRLRSEIGSEFWDVPLKEKANGFFSEGTEWFLSGRSALNTIIADIKGKRPIRTAWLPSWCCDSMILPFLKHGIDVKFYPVFLKAGQLIQDVANAGQDEILFLMDYFGYTDSACVDYGNAAVIRDVTHSVFSHTYQDADYYFGSLRKWCAFKTGGFALGTKSRFFKTDSAYVTMRTSAMQQKQAYIHGQSDQKDFLQIFANAEEYLEECSGAAAAPSDIRDAFYLDIAFLKERRRRNALILLQAFQDISIFKTMKENDCPLFVPVAIDGGTRDALRRYLVERKIYLPVHWPMSKYHKLEDKTEVLYERELSLVCDQRYGEDDMYRIVETVNQFFKR